MKKLFLSLLIFASHYAKGIIYYQLNPIQATVTSIGNQYYSIECSTFDSSLNAVVTGTPVKWLNNQIILTSNNKPFITFKTVNGRYYGAIVYDPVLNNFNAMIQSHNDPHYPVAYINSYSDGVYYGYDCCYNPIEGGPNYSTYVSKSYLLESNSWFDLSSVTNYNYDINGYHCSANVSNWQVSRYCDDFDFNPYYSFSFTSPLGGASFGEIATEGSDKGNIMIYSITTDGTLTNYTSKIYCLNPSTRKFDSFGVDESAVVADYMNGNFVIQNYTWSTKSYAGFFDGHLGTFSIDSMIPDSIDFLVLRNGITAWADGTVNPVKVHFRAYNHITHQMVSDSVVSPYGVSNLNIVDGTVHWSDNSGNQFMRGYTDTSGWGNYPTPTKLDFEYVNYFDSIGYPIIYVWNTSIGVDTVQFEFSDGAFTTYSSAWLAKNQPSLFHRFKVNHGYHQAPNDTFRVCIKAGNSQGMHQVCKDIIMTTCSQAGWVSALQDTLCLGDSLHLSISNYSGTIQWQRNGVDIPGANNPVLNDTVTVDGFYRVKVTNGNCTSVYSNTVIIKVGKPATSGTLSSNISVACFGIPVTLTMSGSSNYSFIQKNEGSGWMSASLTATDSTNQWIWYLNGNTQFRMISMSMGCPFDTSNIITVATTDTIKPIAAGDTLCSAGYATLTATPTMPNGAIEWFNNPNLLNPVHTGNTFTTYLSSSADFYAREKISSLKDTIGLYLPIDGVGEWDEGGIVFRVDIDKEALIESVSLWGNIDDSIKVRIAYNGNNQTVFEKTIGPNQLGTIPLNCYLKPGFYKILMVPYLATNFSLNTEIYSYTNFSFPFNSPNSPITLLYSIGPSIYMYFYRWIVHSVCNSDTATVTAVVNPYSPHPVISATGSTFPCPGDSVVLSVPVHPAYTNYQWLRDFQPVANANQPVYAAYQRGLYQCIVYDVACQDTSAGYKVKFRSSCPTPLGIHESGNSEQFVSVYPNPFSTDVTVETEGFGPALHVNLLNLAGQVVFTHDPIDIHQFNLDLSSYAPGCYFLELSDGFTKLNYRLVKL